MNAEDALGEADQRPRTSSQGVLHCLAYVPNIYNGGGTTQTLIWILEHFERAGIRPVVYFERTWQFPRKVPAVSLFPAFLRRIPGTWTSMVPKYLIERAFLKRLSRHSPKDTFVYIWPQPRLALIKAIKARGFCIVRELINCPGPVCIAQVRAARINAGFADRELSTDAAIEQELQHFRLCDYVTAPNSEVEQALLGIHLPSEKIISTSFGWAEERFRGPRETTCASASGAGEDPPFTTVFVGHIGVRKGVHYLFEAWKDLPPSMHLQLVGTVDPEIQPLLSEALQDDRIVHIPYTPDLDQILRAADVFAFPTVEEGGPQVTFEAAGCGLPVVTTPMGAARLILDEQNGLIVPPHDVPALKAALLELYRNPQKCAALARQAELDAQAFTYEKVGACRAKLFRNKFADYLKAGR